MIVVYGNFEWFCNNWTSPKTLPEPSRIVVVLPMFFTAGINLTEILYFVCIYR